MQEQEHLQSQQEGKGQRKLQLGRIQQQLLHPQNSLQQCDFLSKQQHQFDKEQLVDERQLLHLQFCSQLQHPEKQSQHLQQIQDKFKHRIRLHGKSLVKSLVFDEI